MFSFSCYLTVDIEISSHQGFCKESVGTLYEPLGTR